MNKKILTRLIGLFVFGVCLPISAYDFESGGIYYYFIKNTNEVVVGSGDSKYQGDIVIPEKVTYNGKDYSVTSIGNGAFESCIELTSISFPNSLTRIGKDAFDGCRGLTSLTIPNSVISIDECAFVNCSSLTSISFHNNNIMIVGGVFHDTPWYDNQPDGLVYAGKIAYSYKGDIPANTTITLMEGTLGISGGAFWECEGLTSITIPNTVTWIGDNAFTGCSSLTFIKVENGNTTYDSRDNCNAIINTASNTLIVGSNNTIIPNSVKSIGYNAFNGRTGLSSIIIPNSVTSISSEAFWNCTSLTSIISEINNPFEIADNVFYSKTDVYSNATLTVPIGTKNVYQSTDGWKNFHNIVEAKIDNPIRTIHVATAGSLSDYISEYEKYGIEELTLTGSLNGTDFRLLREMAGVDFRGKKTDGSLKVLDISGARVVAGGDRYIDIPGGRHFSIDNNDVVPEYVFHDCSLIEIALPSGAKVIEDEAFENCAVLRTVTLPEKLTSIRGEAFNGCRRLNSLTIPSGVTFIGAEAFANCIELISVNAQIVSPNAISDDVFSSTTYNNARLIVPLNSLSAYKSTNGWKKFNTIVEYVASERISADGVEYLCSSDDLSASVVKVSSSLKDVRIPSTVKGRGGDYTVNSIEDNAFSGCDLNYLSLPETITTLTENTFASSKISAISWNADTQLNKKAFRNSTMSTDNNFLLYVKSADCAPQTVANVIVNNSAESITLSDSGDNFYCPIAFTAKKISFTHRYNMETGGSGKGWETIVLPFNVQKITHSTKGEIVPFALYSSGSSKKPFWLYRFGSNGTGGSFVSANSILSNTPYIIAMPNQSGYQDGYILTGDVTFSSENVIVERTIDFNGIFVPAYSTVPKSSNVYALNVINSYVNNTGGYDAGSSFIRNLRDVRPFEAYFTLGSSTRGVIGVNIGDGTTNMDALLNEENPNAIVNIYTLSGQLVDKTYQKTLESRLKNLPKGVYVVNGKKLVRQ